MSRFAILWVAGHLLCLAGFEWSKAWEFFPANFRPTHALILSLAFFMSILLSEWKADDRPAAGVVLCAWASIMGFALLKNPLIESASLVFLGVPLLLMLLAGTRAVYGIAILAILVLGAVVEWAPFAPVGFLLVAMTGLEWRLLHQRDLPPPPRAADLRPRAEISWRGFAQLYSTCAPGEGEKFSRQVLSDTVRVVAQCGGTLESGSEHRGVYLFGDASSRENCHQVLQQYEAQLEQVLDSADAPGVQLTFKVVDR